MVNDDNLEPTLKELSEAAGGRELYAREYDDASAFLHKLQSMMYAKTLSWDDYDNAVRAVADYTQMIEKLPNESEEVSFSDYITKRGYGKYL